MIRKLVLLASILFLGLPGSYLVWEHFSGKRHLARTIAKLRAAGETLEIDPLAPPQPSSASNGLPRLQRIVPLLADGARLNPPAMECITPGRALTFAQRKSWEIGSRQSTDWTEVSDWIASAATNLSEIRSALAMPDCRQQLDYSQGFSLSLPHLAQLKAAAMALSTSAAVAAHGGQLNQALADLSAIDRCVSNLGRDPVIICQLVSVAVASIAMNRTWDILHAQPWTDEQLRGIADSLPSDDFLRNTLVSLEGERALGLVSMRSLKPHQVDELLGGMNAALGGAAPPTLAVPTTLDEASELAGELTSVLAETLRKHVFRRLWHFAFHDHAVAVYLESFQLFLESHRQCIAARRIPPPAGDLLELLLSRSDSRVRNWTPNAYAEATLPTLQAAVSRPFRTDIQRTLLRLDIALQRYKLRHHQFPPTLQELVPDFLPAVPLDPADGKPFHYQLESPDASPKLWSSGENGVDDGGDASPSADSTVGAHNWWRGKDAVWPQPASTSDIAAAESKERRVRTASPITATSSSGSNRFVMSPELMKRYGLLPKSPDTTTPPSPPAADTNEPPK